MENNDATVPAPEPAPDDLIPPTRAARILRCHVATVHRWVLSGRIRAWRVGPQRHMVSEAEVRAQIVRVPPRPGRPCSPKPQPVANDDWAKEYLRQRGYQQ